MVVKKLATITGNEDEVKSESSEADDYDYYEGFELMKMEAKSWTKKIWKTSAGP